MLDEQRKADGIREVIVTSDKSSKSPTLADAASLAGLDGVAIRTGEVKLAYSWGSETEIWRGLRNR